MGILGNFKKLFAKKKRRAKRKARYTDSKKVKQERIDAGFKKIYAFIDKGMRLNPVPKKSLLAIIREGNKIGKVKKYPNHFKATPKVRWFFKCGDAGYQPHTTKLGMQVPVPYSR